MVVLSQFRSYSFSHSQNINIQIGLASAYLYVSGLFCCAVCVG